MMGSRSALVVALALAVLASAGSLHAQRLDPDAVRARLADSRPLDDTEIDRLLAAVRMTAGGRPFRFAADDAGFLARALFERDGHVRYIQRASDGRTTFSEYTGRIARLCDGAVAAGEMVLEYRQSADGWAVSTRASSPADELRPIFDMLLGLKPLVDAGVTPDGNRVLGVAWNPGGRRGRPTGGGGGALPAHQFALADPSVSGVETITIDARTLLPARWAFAFAPAAAPSDTAAYRFSFDDEVVLTAPPIDAALPGCVENAPMLR